MGPLGGQPPGPHRGQVWNDSCPHVWSGLYGTFLCRWQPGGELSDDHADLCGNVRRRHFRAHDNVYVCGQEQPGDKRVQLNWMGIPAPANDQQRLGGRFHIHVWKRQPSLHLLVQLACERNEHCRWRCRQPHGNYFCVQHALLRWPHRRALQHGQCGQPGGVWTSDCQDLEFRWGYASLANTS